MVKEQNRFKRNELHSLSLPSNNSQIALKQMPGLPTKMRVPKTAALGTDCKSEGASNGSPILGLHMLAMRKTEAFYSFVVAAPYLKLVYLVSKCDKSLNLGCN